MPFIQEIDYIFKDKMFYLAGGAGQEKELSFVSFF
jgi:hypothetical protein